MCTVIWSFCLLALIHSDVLLQLFDIVEFQQSWCFSWSQGTATDKAKCILHRQQMKVPVLSNLGRSLLFSIFIALCKVGSSQPNSVLAFRTSGS